MNDNDGDNEKWKTPIAILSRGHETWSEHEWCYIHPQPRKSPFPCSVDGLTECAKTAVVVAVGCWREKTWSLRSVDRGGGGC